MSRSMSNGGNLLDFNWRGGAQHSHPLLERKQTGRDKTTLRALALAEHIQDYAVRAREFSRMDLLEKRSIVSKAFGATVRHFRKLHGYSQEELATICGIDRTYPSLLERGLRSPTIGVVIALSCALKITPVELYCTFLDTLRDRALANSQNRPVPTDTGFSSIEGALVSPAFPLPEQARLIERQTHS